jgi:regulator of protease activity HflC (stomatin/prohibitin superfamily)
VTTLITSIKLPPEVQESMNHIIASKNNLASAQNDADAKKVQVVTAAKAKAEAMAAEGRGIADQRTAIAEGISKSLDIISESGVGTDEANALFQFTQWCDMMSHYADTGASTVVLPADFRETASMFEQMTVAGIAPSKPEPPVRPGHKA